MADGILERVKESRTEKLQFHDLRHSDGRWLAKNEVKVVQFVK